MSALAAATHIDVEAGVRYWEDAAVNGVQEDDDAPTIFGAEGNTWKVRVRLADGRIEGWPEGMAASIHYKVCDEGEYWLSDDSGARVAKWKGYYVPNDFLCHGEEGFGDYIIMEVGPDGIIAGYEVPIIEPERWK
jgi:hypothetical protein